MPALSLSTDDETTTWLTETWELYLRKSAHDLTQGRQRTPPQEWAAAFARRLGAYRRQWDNELQDYVAGQIPAFDGVERLIKRRLGPVLAAARALSG